MFFVVGTGRCGTTSIAELISQAPNCKCIHELKPQLIREAVQYLYEELSEEELSRLLLSTRPQMIDGKTFGESNHQLGLIIPVLQKVYPDAKFVWLIRDGRDTVASMYARNWYAGRPYTLLGRVNLWEEWRIRGDYMNVMSHQEWRSLLRFERCCWHWAFVNQLIESSLIENECNWIQLRLENLHAQVDYLYDFLGLRHPPQLTIIGANHIPHKNKSDERSGSTPSPWQQWRPQQVQQFKSHCANLMNKHYPDWQENQSEQWKRSYLSHSERIGIRLNRQREVLFGPYSPYANLRDEFECFVRKLARYWLPKNTRANIRSILMRN